MTRRVALMGNPNVGKSTIFNGLTRLRQHTGNWAGVTVSWQPWDSFPMAARIFPPWIFPASTPLYPFR